MKRIPSFRQNAPRGPEKKRLMLTSRKTQVNTHRVKEHLVEAEVTSSEHGNQAKFLKHKVSQKQEEF